MGWTTTAVRWTTVATRRRRPSFLGLASRNKHQWNSQGGFKIIRAMVTDYAWRDSRGLRREAGPHVGQDFVRGGGVADSPPPPSGSFNSRDVRANWKKRTRNQYTLYFTFLYFPAIVVLASIPNSCPCILSLINKASY